MFGIWIIWDMHLEALECFGIEDRLWGSDPVISDAGNYTENSYSSLFSIFCKPILIHDFGLVL